MERHLSKFNLSATAKRSLQFLPLLVSTMLIPASASAQCLSCVNAVTLPASATISNSLFNTATQVASNGYGYFSITLSGVPTGNSLGNQTYQAWCGTWFNASLINGPAGPFPLTSTYSTSYPAANRPLTTTNTINMVDYILNNKQGSVQDVQDAIWLIMTGNSGDIPSSTATAMVTAAQANPAYIPPAGGVLAVLMAVDPGVLANNASAGGSVYQNLFLEVPVPSITQQCSTCVNAITLPATASYASGGGTFNDATLAANTGYGYFSLTLSGVPTGYSIANQLYQAWCAGWFNAGFNGGPGTYPIVSTYGSSLPASAAPIVAGSTLNMINYILNNKQGTVSDVQDAIWIIMTGNAGTTLSAAAQAMVTAAQANPTYCPPTGGVIALFLATNTTALPTTASVGGSQYQNLFIEVTCTGTTNQGTPGISLKKTANVAKCNPFQKVTYTYVVTNTGTVALSNITVVDDNGTPAYSKDDFTVGTIKTLAAGASATLTANIYPPVTEAANYDEGWGLTWGWNNSGWDFDDKNALPGGLLICKDDGKGKLQFTYMDDKAHTDNTYGNNSSWDWGWWGHSFSTMAANDGAEFQILDKNGNNCLDFAVDYVSPSTKYKSGYGTLGIKGGGGACYKGDATKVLAIDTSLSHNLNAQTKNFQCTTNSSSDKSWDNNHSYTVTIDQSACGQAGFGGVKCPLSHNGSTKWWGCGDRVMRPTSSTVTNTAVASVTVNGKVITATATATVTVDASRTGWSQCTKY